MRFPQDTVTKIPVIHSSSQSTGYLLLYRNDDQTSMRANMRTPMDAFPLFWVMVNTKGREPLSTNGDGKRFLWGQLKHWSSSVHSISSGYWYKSIFLEKMWEQTRNSLCRFSRLLHKWSGVAWHCFFTQSLNFTIDNRYCLLLLSHFNFWLHFIGVSIINCISSTTLIKLVIHKAICIA